MKAYVSYGGKPVSFKLPEEWRLVKIAVPAKEPKVVNEHYTIKSGLHSPVGTDKLDQIVKPRKKVAIIIDDKSRPTPTSKIVSFLLDQLNGLGVSDEDVKIIVALGLHPKNTPDELERKLGKNVLGRVKVVNHNPDDNLTYLGETSYKTPVFINSDVVKADVKISIGNISPHPAAGYSGGPKIILPGVSGRTTIFKNHALFRDPGAVVGRLDGNPVLSDEVEAARMAGLDFIINTVLNSKGRIMKVFAGDFVEAHRTGVAFFESLYKISSPIVDVSIVSSYPADIDLYQAWKAIFPASLVTRKGGIIILVSPCFEGIREEHYQAIANLELHKLNCEELYRVVKRGLPDYVFGLVYYKLRTMIEDKRIIIVTSGIPEEKIRHMGFEYAKNIEEAVRIVKSELDEAKVLVAPHGAKILLSPS